MAASLTLNVTSWTPRSFRWAFLPIPNPSPRVTKPHLCRKSLTLFFVALLATISSAALVRDTAALEIPVTPTTAVLSAATVVPLVAIDHPHADPATSNRKHELRRFRARSPQSGGGSPGDDTPPKSSDQKSSSTASSPTTTSKAKTTSTGVSDSTPLPQPFDSAPAAQFKSDGADNSCPNFMSNLFSSPTFKSCYPLSMMLQTSTGLFQAEKTLLGIVRVLDATCKADSTSCATFFDQAAQNLTSNCKVEVQQNQTLVLQAYRGMVTYRTLYAASCLQDPKTNQYCFANAVTNLQTPSDVYLYFMPYGLSLPGSSSPSCSWCTQQTMGIFHSASADRKQFVASVYQAAAVQVNTLCGPNYVNGTLPAASLGISILPPSQYAIIFTTLVVITLGLYSL